jgi:hypothetical protein
VAGDGAYVGGRGGVRHVPLLGAAAVGALGRATLEILALELAGAAPQLPAGEVRAADIGRAEVVARDAAGIVVVAAAQTADAGPAASVRAAAADVILGLVR